MYNILFRDICLNNYCCSDESLISLLKVNFRFKHDSIYFVSLTSEEAVMAEFGIRLFSIPSGDMQSEKV